MDSVCLAAFRVDTDFNTDSSAYSVISTGVRGGDANQTSFKPRTVVTTYTPQNKDGSKIESTKIHTSLLHVVLLSLIHI